MTTFIFGGSCYEENVRNSWIGCDWIRMRVSEFTKKFIAYAKENPDKKLGDVIFKDEEFE